MAQSWLCNALTTKDNQAVLERGGRLVIVWQTQKNDSFTGRPCYAILRIILLNPDSKVVHVEVESEGFLAEIERLVIGGHFLRAMAAANDASLKVCRECDGICTELSTEKGRASSL